MCISQNVCYRTTVLLLRRKLGTRPLAPEIKDILSFYVAIQLQHALMLSISCSPGLFCLLCCSLPMVQLRCSPTVALLPLEEKEKWKEDLGFFG